MKKLFVVLFFCVIASGAFAQQKFALVIGNGNYANVTKLNNPVNDANDMTATLQALGFTVDKVLNGTLDQMESAAIRLKNRLSASKSSYGFLFYAGHGVQSGGENYLIPVDANIQSESFLRQRAVSVQAVLDELNEAGNELNVVVLDACRDNPFSWKRSGSRGLQVVGNQPADSIIVFATSAGSTSSDGEGRNGLFTSHLLNRLKQPGIEVAEVFRLTMGDVTRASGSQQRPAVYNQFAGLAYLGSRPATAASAEPAQTPAPTVQPAPTPTPAVQPAAQPQHLTQTYKIGDRGPAGGIVFYDKEQYTDGWRYMEAAPSDLKKAQWGLYGEDVAGSKTGIGSGKQNTELIVAALSRKGETGKAAQLCRAYTLNGFNDWFLPSEDELNELYKNRASVGNMRTGIYWSSSQCYGFNAWYQRFSDGFQYDYGKNNANSVRAVRVF
jgi:uncharacterized caspase-like protein